MRCFYPKLLEEKKNFFFFFFYISYCQNPPSQTPTTKIKIKKDFFFLIFSQKCTCIF